MFVILTVGVGFTFCGVTVRVTVYLPSTDLRVKVLLAVLVIVVSVLPTFAVRLSIVVSLSKVSIVTEGVAPAGTE